MNGMPTQHILQEQVLPEKTRDRHRHHVGDQHQAPDRTRQRKLFIEEQREQIADRKLEDQAPEGEDKCILQDQEKCRVAEQFFIILQSDKYGCSLCQVLDIGILEAQDEIVDDRISDHQDHINDTREYESVSFHISPVCLSPGRLFRNSRHGEGPFLLRPQPSLFLQSTFPAEVLYC